MECAYDPAIPELWRVDYDRGDLSLTVDKVTKKRLLVTWTRGGVHLVETYRLRKKKKK